MVARKSRATAKGLSVKDAWAIAEADHNRDLALTETEHERWQGYQRTMPEHFGTFSLTQLAENDHAVTCRNDIMYTVI